LGLFEKIFGTYSERQLKPVQETVSRIEELAPQYASMTDRELAACTPAFKERLAQGETLDDLLPEAFAVCREASTRVLGMRHFPVQLTGGIVLHQGRIAEMKTGEGKTLVATLPAYLNALTGKGVHIVTVNEYLARRDSEWMGKLYRFLGLTVGLVVPQGAGTPDSEAKKAAYQADITYGTNNEFGFDYLRDNMVIYQEQMVQRGHAFAIVDEVDSILVDEARTPLIISGAGDKSTEMYGVVDAFVRRLRMAKFKELDDKEEQDDIDADYVVDEKARTATLTPAGIKKAESAFKIENLSDPENSGLSHHLNQAIRAHGLMHRDINYVVKDGDVIIVDEFTGRMMFGRRYSEGLHQAIEAKENVKVERESKTLATITFQNYFRLYDKLSGMTGTALTEETEFREIYKLDVIEIPTNKPMIRKDHPDSVYKTIQGKYHAVMRQIEECHAKGQPVLVGTVAIETSELLSSMLKKRGIRHEVLNAKHHAREAEIVAQAGKKGAVTIATNMAGRGTDIVLGGNPEYMAKSEMRKMGLSEELIEASTGHGETDDQELIEARQTFAELEAKYRAATSAEADFVRSAGGLFILGTERHDSRRIDNQLRGRAGRQGDPGESRFYLSLEDDLMRLFGSERMAGIVEGLGLDEDTPIEHRMLSSAIENAQKKVEGRNFDTRKHVLQYDDVMNKQREIIYGQRGQVLRGDDLKPSVLKMIEDHIDDALVRACAPDAASDDWNFAYLQEQFYPLFMPKGSLAFDFDALNHLTVEDLRQLLLDNAMRRYQERETELTPELMRELERVVVLKVVDRYWMDHIDQMDELRKGIGLRAYGQHDPVTEYKNEGYNMFEEMIGMIKQDTTRLMYLANIARPEETIKREQVAQPTSTSSDGTDPSAKTVRRSGQKVGRNEPCPCGSGKKYKRCCGA
jgi:preprotein translocase subunit SecA